MKLTSTPYNIHTFLTCDDGCQHYTGFNSVRNLTRDGFQVYLASPDFDVTPEALKAGNTELHWEIKAKRLLG